MEITFNELTSGFANCKVVLDEDKVRFFFKSIYREYQVEFDYNELVEIFRVKEGNRDWTGIGVLLLAIAWFTLIFLSYFTIYARPIAATIAVTSVIPFLLRLYKEEWVYFYKENSVFAFSIKITKQNKDDVEKAVELIQSRNKK
jgi:hypothetical protein